MNLNDYFKKNNIASPHPLTPSPQGEGGHPAIN